MNPLTATTNRKNHLVNMENWFTKWRFKVHQSKSIHTTFTLRQAPCPNDFLYDTSIPCFSIVKYLGLTLDQRLTWADHIKTKRLALNNRLRMLKIILCNNKYTSTDHRNQTSYVQKSTQTNMDIRSGVTG